MPYPNAGTDRSAERPLNRREKRMQFPPRGRACHPGKPPGPNPASSVKGFMRAFGLLMVRSLRAMRGEPRDHPRRITIRARARLVRVHWGLPMSGGVFAMGYGTGLAWQAEGFCLATCAVTVWCIGFFAAIGALAMTMERCPTCGGRMTADGICDFNELFLDGGLSEEFGDTPCPPHPMFGISVE